MPAMDPPAASAPSAECGQVPTQGLRELWAPSDRARWRDATEHYEPAARSGNQQLYPLTNDVGGDPYLNAMHPRIHALFADRFEKSLSGLPCEHPLNDRQLKVRLQIELTPDGHVKRMGVVLASGQIDFDIAALDSVDRAQPFGNTPTRLQSPDGMVYMHWDFYRDETHACSTVGARLYLPRAAPVPTPQE
jgi:TonB family protein